MSYSHSDSSRVFPILEALEKRGFRIWFDQGIELGAEWPESVAMHLSNCTVCLAFLSQNSVQSVNCRQEISYAIKQKKGILSVYLEKTDLSMGLDMQLSAYQQVFSTQYADKDRFYAQLESTPVLQPCRRQETPGPSAQSHTGRRIVRLAVAALARHRQAAMLNPLPFVSLSRLLGRGGYLLCAGAMLAAALSTLCAMLAALLRALPQGRGAPWLAAALCLFFSRFGFTALVERGYPMLGALCAALLVLLCLPLYQVSSSSR